MNFTIYIPETWKSHPLSFEEWMVKIQNVKYFDEQKLTI